MNIHENLYKTMKVLRWQEANMESSKGFYRGSRSYLKSLKLSHPEIHENPWKSIKVDEIYGNLKKTEKIYEMWWKSSDDRKPAWNRAKVSVGAAGRTLRPDQVVSTHAPKSMTIFENL